jgi:hypothetical protein
MTMQLTLIIHGPNVHLRCDGVFGSASNQWVDKAM